MFEKELKTIDHNNKQNAQTICWLKTKCCQVHVQNLWHWISPTAVRPNIHKTYLAQAVLNDAQQIFIIKND